MNTMKRSPVPTELRPERVYVTYDRREQRRLNLSPLPMVPATLQTADYGLLHMPNEAAVEWKYENDLISTLTSDRERWEKEVVRLLGYPCRAVVTSWTWDRIEAGDWQGDAKPNAIFGSLVGIVESGVPLIMAGSRERAERVISRLLYCAARRAYRDCRSMVLCALDDSEIPQQEAAL